MNSQNIFGTFFFSIVPLGEVCFSQLLFNARYFTRVIIVRVLNFSNCLHLKRENFMATFYTRSMSVV
jgi:hypothetical protein